MIDKKILAISFYGSTKHQLIPYKSIDYVDVIAFETNIYNAGVPGSIEDFEKLNIEYTKYYAVITWGDSLFPVVEYFFKKCIENNITIYGNQHGVNKSIVQILFSSPNKYCKYWNAEGEWMLKRFKSVLKSNPIERRWISIGSTYHEYLFNNFSWNKENSNNRILLIHEPNLKSAEGDKFPHDSEMIINEVIKIGYKHGYEIDLKVHPNWKGKYGNNGESITIFNCNYVDLQFTDVIKYSLVIGSRSSLLYESYLTGIPVFAVESHSEWIDDCISFLDLKLVDIFSICEIEEGIKKRFNNPKSKSLDIIEFLSGSLIKGVLDKYIKFIKHDNLHKDQRLGKRLYNKYLSLINKTDNNRFKKLVIMKIIKEYPKLFKIINYLTKI
jgi:hypothetical protein